MIANVAKKGVLDRLAIGLSGLCLVHCLGSAVLLGLLASASGWLLNPIWHEVGLAMALPLGCFALGRGVFTHRYVLPAAVGGVGLGLMAYSLWIGHENGGEVWSVVGVLLLALGHDLNRRAAH